MVLAYNCLEVAAKLGHYHRAIQRLQPGEELPNWIPTPEVLAGDPWLDYVDAFTLLGDAMHPAFGHPKVLARAYDHVCYEGREMGNLPLRGKKSIDQSAMVYQAEYAQIVHRLSTLTRIDCEKFVRPMPTSLVHPEMVYPNKRYEAYCLKVPESGPVAQYEPVSNYEMDGLWPRVDLRPGTEVPVYPDDDVDADPSFNKYPAQEEFVEGPDWVPGQIPSKIRSPEYGGGLSDASFDMQVARAIKAVSVTTAPEPDEAVASTSATGDMRRVELTPLPGPEPAVYTTDGVGDPEADPGVESEAGQESLAPVCQLGDAAAIFGTCLSLPLPVFPDGPSHPLPNIGTTAGVGGTVGGGTCPVLACRPVCWNQPTTTRSPQGELTRESVQPW